MTRPRESQLDGRWQELVNLTAEQFWENNQSPGGGVFEPDREQLKLRAILADGGYFCVQLTVDQVLNDDLLHVAQQFYRAYRSARGIP